MPQYQKETVRERVLSAALTLFASDGYQNVSVGRISKASGVPVGNIYRYFSGKDDILASVLPKSFVEDFLRLTREKILTSARETVDQQRRDAAFIQNSEQYFRFTIENRLRLLILRRPAGTPYEGALETIMDAVAQLIAGRSGGEADALLPLIHILLAGYQELTFAVLAAECTDEVRLLRLRQINVYHVGGIAALLDGAHPENG